MKDYLVEFLEGGARIHKDTLIIEERKHQDNVLLNPELPIGVSPSFWKKDGDKISIMSIDEAKVVANIELKNHLEKNILKGKLEEKEVEEVISDMENSELYNKLNDYVDRLLNKLKNSPPEKEVIYVDKPYPVEKIVIKEVPIEIIKEIQIEKEKLLEVPCGNKHLKPRHIILGIAVGFVLGLLTTLL